MDKKKIVMVLLLIALVFSVVSISLNIYLDNFGLSKMNSSGSGGLDNGGRVVVFVENSTTGGNAG